MNLVANKERRDLSRDSVLLVDDEKYVVEVIQKIISNWVGSIECVTSAREALELIEINDYDYILLDVRMPKMDGKELYNRIKLMKPHLINRIIFLTGDTESEDIRQFFILNKANYLSKPFAIRELLDTMSKLGDGL